MDDAELSRGFQIVAPEHRLSLELKHVEQVSDVKDELQGLLDNTQYIDIFDEADALLSHKYHLVYAAGDSLPLPSGCDRWCVAEVLHGATWCKDYIPAKSM